MEMTVYSLLKLVRSEKLGKLDVDNYIQKLTDNYNIEKLKKLLIDTENYLTNEKEEKFSEFSDDEINSAREEIRKRKLAKLFKDKPYLINQGINVFVHKIDVELKLFPFEFITIYLLIQNIKSKIKNAETQINKFNKNDKEPLTFAGLFKIPYNSETKIMELKTILKTSGYIDDKYKWSGLTGFKNKLATLYWLFKDKLNILNPGKVTPQLKTFYKEFGLIVYTDKEPQGDCTIKNINTHPGINSDTYKEFERFFLNWISRG